MIPAHRANYEWQAWFRCGRSFVSTIGYSSVFNPIMPTGPATIPSSTAYVCICLYFRFPSAGVRLRVRTSGSVCRVCAFNPRHCVYVLTYTHRVSPSPSTGCPNFNRPVVSYVSRAREIIFTITVAVNVSNARMEIKIVSFLFSD